MAYILLNKDGSIPGYTKEEMAQSNEATPWENINHDKFQLSDEFYTKLDEESIKRIERRENKRKEDAKWMIYDKIPYSNQAVPTIGQSSKRGQDYIPHPIEKPFVRQPEQYKRPEGTMDGMTSYKKEYTEKQGLPAQAIRHDGQKVQSGRFEGEPTYRADYKKWDMSRQQPYGMRDSWQAPTQKFEGESTMHHDYRKYNQARREAMRPMEATIRSDQPLADVTDYRAEYRKHPLPPKFQHEREGYKPSSAPLDDLTTFRRDYKGQHGAPVRSFKPDNAAFSSGQPLDDTTTNRKDFVKWPMDRPFVHMPDQYKKPEGEMYTQTTHNATYKQLPLQKNAPLRPTSAGKARNAPFDGVTNYSQDYKKWALQRQQPHAREEYHPNAAPFDGVPTYKAHYIPHGVHPTQSFRPDNRAFMSNAKFEDGTMYRTDYTPKPMIPCPCHDPHLPPNKVIMCEKHNVPVMSTIQKLPVTQMRQPVAVQA